MLTDSIVPHNGLQPASLPPKRRYTVRSLTSDDFELLQGLEHEIWAAQGEPTLCAHYIRLCVEQFGDVCFIAFDGDRAVGYVLNIIRDNEGHCATLAVRPDYRRSRVTYLLVATMTEQLLQRGITECWFTVSPENTAARDIHKTLGAKVVEQRTNYYGPGDTRLLSCIDFSQMDRLRKRFTRAA